MRLSLLLERARVRAPADVFGGATVSGGDPEVRAVTDRDADVGPREGGAGELFVALRGARVDGHDRVPALVQAAAVVVERASSAPPSPSARVSSAPPSPSARATSAPPGVAVLRVPDTRRALPWLCAAALGFPADDMAVVGVTGTNGKTSTTFLVEAMARAAGWKAGVIGTTGHFVAGAKLPAAHTTPTAPETQALLAKMRDAGCRLVAMEVSSIGLASFRADAVRFAAAAFTNLTRDHLDYHGDMEGYAAAKARLFHELGPAVSVLNLADPASAAMAPPGGERWWYRGLRPDVVAASPALLAEDVRLDGGGTHATWRTPRGAFAGGTRLIGAHNVENVLAALGLALAAGVPLDACREGLAALPCVPGRLEPVPNERGVTVLVDYAHTDDALARVLATVRPITRGRVLCVFGCGGDRDRGKRPLMGAAAAAGADLVFVTSDNPRSEDPLAIIADILPGLGSAPHVVEPDRRAAIFAAVASAAPGDVVLVAGKGHEATQTIGATTHPFDDRDVAREALAAVAPPSP